MQFAPYLGDAGVFDGGEIMLGASYPIVEWMLKQRVFSLEDAIARQAGVDRAELRADLEKLLDAKVFLELWVKVRSGWADDEAHLRSYGYE